MMRQRRKPNASHYPCPSPNTFGTGIRLFVPSYQPSCHYPETAESETAMARNIDISYTQRARAARAALCWTSATSGRAGERTTGSSLSPASLETDDQDNNMAYDIQ